MCGHCEGNKSGHVYCLPCFASKSIVPDTLTSTITIDHMRNALKDDRFDGVNELSVEEVEEAYEMMSFVAKYRQLEQTVPFPLYVSDYLDAGLQVATEPEWNELVEIDFKDGGSFMADTERVSTKHLPAVIHFFATLVRFPDSESKYTGWKKDAAVYAALPLAFIEFANKSRFDSGYRLLERCVRHAFDSRMPSMSDKCATIIEHDGEIGIKIDFNLPASMKDNVYSAGVAATGSAILCSKCECRSGAKLGEKVVCVHILPILMKLSLLLFEGLAENILPTGVGA